MKIDHFDFEKNKTFIIAELSANHNQDLGLAKKTIEAMKEAGADAVKLQTYTPDTITIDSNLKHFQIRHGTIWDGQNMYDLYKKAYTPWEWHAELFNFAKELGLVCFSAPFDHSAVDFLEDLGTPAYKIASPEIVDIPLIKYAAAKQKPMIISTGIATLCEIDEAVQACKSVGNDQIILLKCTSAYPTPLEDVNLRTIPHLAQMYNLPVGLSDHTLGIAAPLGAVALGARVVEKHFILSKEIETPDSAFSLTPEEFKGMVEGIRDLEKALGGVSYALTKSMQVGRVGKRSLFAIEDIKQGELLTAKNIASKRPGNGIAPKHYETIIDTKKAKTDIKKGTPLSWDIIE